MTGVNLVIKWQDGSMTFRKFVTCEEAWRFESEFVGKEGRRRNRPKRFPRYSYYYSKVHSTGEVFGGLLRVGNRVGSGDELRAMAEHCHTAKDALSDLESDKARA